MKAVRSSERVGVGEHTHPRWMGNRLPYSTQLAKFTHESGIRLDYLYRC